MAGKTPARAVANFIRPIRKAISFITKTALRVHNPDPSGIQILMLGTGDLVPIRSDSGVVEIRMVMNYRVVKADGDRGPWKVQTAEYLYHFYLDGQERVLYHYHPETTPHIPYPHLHIGEPRIRKTHIPSGRVSIEAFIRFLIDEYGVKAGAGWETALLQSQRRFERYRTWA